MKLNKIVNEPFAKAQWFKCWCCDQANPEVNGGSVQTKAMILLWWWWLFFLCFLFRHGSSQTCFIVANCETKAQHLPYQNDECIVDCPRNCIDDRTVLWGLGNYTEDSTVCGAAIHDFRLKPDFSGRANVTVRKEGFIFYNYPSYIQNGVTSMSFGYFEKTFTFDSPKQNNESVQDITMLVKNYIYLVKKDRISIEIECYGRTNAANKPLEIGAIIGKRGRSNRGKYEAIEVGEDLRQRHYVNVTKEENDTYGIYYCTASDKIYMLSFIMATTRRNNAQFYSEIFTQSLSFGDNTTLRMEQDMAGTVSPDWTKNDNVIRNRNDFERQQTQLNISYARLDDSGIYSMFSIGKKHRRGSIRLIVRSCPQEMYGLDKCDKLCPVCLNGGICHDISGECVCPPGFNGTRCETACPPNRFGGDCSAACSDDDYEEGCMGFQLCRPDPYGCSCAPGFRGIYCNEKCEKGTYGAGCSQKCSSRCLQSECDPYTGNCTCQPGWKGQSCKTSGPVLKSRVEIPSSTITFHGFKVRWHKWQFRQDEGEGDVDLYRIEVLDSSGNIVLQKEVNLDRESFPILIENLKSETNFSVRVRIKSNGVWHSETNPVQYAYTACRAPSKTPEIEIDELKSKSMILQWKDVEKEYRGCDPFFYKVLWKQPATLGTWHENVTNATSIRLKITPALTIAYQVCSVNRISEFCSSDNQTKVPEDIPEAPENFTTSATSTTVSLSWAEPRQKNGIILGYKVSYLLKNTPNSYSGLAKGTVAKQLGIVFRHTLTNLEPGSTYHVGVAANTSAGYGPSITKVVDTDEAIPEAPDGYDSCKSSPNSLTLNWKKPLKSNGQIIKYMIKVKNLKDNEISPVDYDIEPQKGNMSYVIVNLNPYTVYNVSIAAKTKKGYGVFKSLNCTTAPIGNPSGDSVGATVGAVFGCILCLGVLGVAYFFFRKYRERRPALPPGDCQEMQRLNSDRPDRRPNSPKGFNKTINVNHLVEYVKQMKSSGGLKDEYMALPNGQTAAWNTAVKPGNKSKNRYGNIVAYDHSRVILESLDGDPDSDYINACYINGYKKSDAYIATQGPNKDTINDFWRMCWQENVSKIVMVTNLIEDGKCKCEQYWPEDSATYGDIRVKLIEKETLADYTIRSFELQKIGGIKRVKHFNFTSWPDHGVPMCATALVGFVKRVKSYHPPQGGPVVVHCSAGVGRTGTYIVLDAMMDQAKAEGIVNVFGFLEQMRYQRINMVQTLDQYIFLYDALVEAVQGRESNFPCTQFDVVFHALRNVNSTTGKTGLEEQFEALTLLCPVLTEHDCREARTETNRVKNRYQDILPPERARPYLMTYTGPTDGDYINAVYVNGYRRKNAFIVTQMPLPNTIADFWKMIYDHQSVGIVMLNELDPNDESCAQYWPERGSITCGVFRVEMAAIEPMDNVIVRTFKLYCGKKADDPPRTVRQFQLLGWNNRHALPPSKSALFLLMDLVERWQQKNTSGPITVHCMSGAMQSGLYCAISNICDKIKFEHEIDIFQEVKLIRTNRPLFIDSMEQYRFCYEMASAFLDLFETCANFK